MRALSSQLNGTQAKQREEVKYVSTFWTNQTSLKCVVVECSLRIVFVAANISIQRINIVSHISLSRKTDRKITKKKKIKKKLCVKTDLPRGTKNLICAFWILKKKRKRNKQKINSMISEWIMRVRATTQCRGRECKRMELKKPKRIHWAHFPVKLTIIGLVGSLVSRCVRMCVIGNGPTAICCAFGNNIFIRVRSQFFSFSHSVL